MEGEDERVAIEDEHQVAEVAASVHAEHEKACHVGG
jgi:hypothetical protein